MGVVEIEATLLPSYTESVDKAIERIEAEADEPIGDHEVASIEEINASSSTFRDEVKGYMALMRNARGGDMWSMREARKMGMGHFLSDKFSPSYVTMAAFLNDAQEGELRALAAE